MRSSSGLEGKGSQAKDRDEDRDEERREQEHRQKQKQEEQQGLVLWVRGDGRGAYVWLEY